MKSKHVPCTNQTVLDNPYIKDCLVFDLETDSVITDYAKIKWIGAYSYKNQMYYCFGPEELYEFQKLIDDHRVLVGYNNKWFDCPILANNGFKIDYKVIFDCMGVIYNPEKHFPNRKTIIKLSSGKHLDAACKTNKLKDISKALGAKTSKGDIDYNVFKKKEWTEQEIKDIEKYLGIDIYLTCYVFEWLVDYFDSFRDLVGDNDIKNFNYIRSSTGSFAYSAICHACDMTPEFSNIYDREPYEGAYVIDPKVDIADDVIMVDFTSLYPHLQVQCNLFSPTKTDTDSWTGDEFFKVEGRYNKEEQGRIERELYKMFQTRYELKKKGDPKELAYKIVINSVYGISSSPNFMKIYNETIAGDTTGLGRQCLQTAAKYFDDAGFWTLYGDTDSCFVQMNGKTKEELLEVCEKITEKLKSHMPFPVDSFKLNVDAEIKKVWFHGKKMYVYINTDNEIKIKGLPIIKSDATKISKMIFAMLKPKMLEKMDIQFYQDEIADIAVGMIKKDPELMGQRFNVKDISMYKSNTSIYAQISEAFGEGSHILFPNKKLGKVGKSKKYCTKEELRELDFSDLILDKFWEEMRPFIRNFLSKKEKAKVRSLAYDLNQKKLDMMIDNDNFDSEMVGDDITNEEFIENEIFFAMEE